MVGVRSTFRYALLASSGVNFPRCFLSADSEITTLVLNGVTNTEPSVVSAANTLNMFIPHCPTRNSRNFSARSVRVRYDGATPGGPGPFSTWVPVLQRAAWNSYAVGQTGTYRGLAVTCVDKYRGNPGPSGEL